MIETKYNYFEVQLRLKTTYKLSNKQTMLLFQSRQILKIAIPVPPEVPQDFAPIRIVGLSMGLDHESCTKAEYQQLFVVPPLQSGPGEQWTKGTQGVLGRIVDEEEHKLSGLVANRVDCVVATFRPPFKETEGEQPLMWPDRIYVDKVEVNNREM